MIAYYVSESLSRSY